MLVYSEEHNGFVPRNTGGSTPWIIAFMPYLGGDHATKTDYREIKIYSCPSFPTKGAGANDASGVPVPNKEQTVDYVLNSWMDDVTEFHGLTKVTEFRHPHSTGQRRVAQRRHNRKERDPINDPSLEGLGCNNMFLDGHSEWVAAEDNLPRLWRPK